MAGTIEPVDWMHMGEDERLIWAGNPTLWTLAINVVVGLALIIFGISLTIAFAVGLSWVPPMISGPLVLVPLVLALMGVLVIAYPLILLLHTHYVITTDELYRKTGFLRRDVENLSHGMIQNTSCNQSLLERALSFGDVMVFTAGTDSTELVLMNVKQPQRIMEIINDVTDDSNESPNSSASSEGSPIDQTSP